MFDFTSFIVGIATGISVTALIVGAHIFNKEQRQMEQETKFDRHTRDVEEIINGHTNY